MDELQREAVFEFLDELRESGDTNMFGAGVYIENAFDVDGPAARKLLGEWMRTFGARHPKEESA